MKIDRETLDRMAHLARLEIKEEEVNKYIKDLSQVLTWMEKLNEVDTENVEPLLTTSKEKNRWREDIANNNFDREAMLKNAPDSDGKFIKVPKVIK